MSRKQQFGVLILVLCAGIMFSFLYCIGGWQALMIMGGAFIFFIIVGIGLWLLLDYKR